MEKINMNNRTLSLSQYVGRYIRQVRLENGLSGSELAKCVHISQQQISRYERGQTGFQLDVLFRLLIALKMDEHEMKMFLHQIVNKTMVISDDVNFSDNINRDERFK